VNERKSDKNDIKFISNAFRHGGDLFDNDKGKYEVDNRQRNKENFGNTKKITTKIEIG
jgi:hypothetical protein